jgi:hypothetical protein
MPPIARNIRQAGQRRRYVVGAVVLAAGLAAAAAIVVTGTPRGVRVALLLVFWLSGLLLFQAKECT